MFSLLVLAALAVVAVVTSFISGIFGMAGGMLLIGFLLVLLPVPVAMAFHGVIQIAANGWRAWLWRHHVKWSVVLQFGAGAASSLIVFSFFNFVPDKALVLMMVGLTPFIALAVPQRIAPDIERGGQAFLAGMIGGAMQLVSGVTGPLLDRLPDDCTFADVQRGIAVLMWPKQGDGSLKPPERLAPEEVKRRLREWLKSEKDK